MPSPEDEAVALATRPDGSFDGELFRSEYDRALAERRDKLRRDARAAWRAIDGWRAVKTPEAWDAMLLRADEGLDSGAFLIERLGAERYLDPTLIAGLLAHRRRLIEEHGVSTAAELLLVDSAVLAFYHQLRVSGWVGDLALQLEAELFDEAGPTAKLKRWHGRQAVGGLQAEDLVQRMAERLLPLVDRANKMLLRNLKALKEHKQAPTPRLSIGSAGQVNVAHRQLNTGSGAGALAEQAGAGPGHPRGLIQVREEEPGLLPAGRAELLSEDLGLDPQGGRELPDRPRVRPDPT